MLFPTERDRWEDQCVDGRMGSKWTLGRLVGGVWSGFTWLRIGTVGGLLWMRWWTLGFWRHGVRLSPPPFGRRREVLAIQSRSLVYCSYLVHGSWQVFTSIIASKLLWSTSKTSYTYPHLVFVLGNREVKWSQLRTLVALGGERRYSSYAILTSALEGGMLSALRLGRALPPVPIVQEDRWAPEPVWPLSEIEPRSSVT
jgi:hypothetical protein